MTDFRALCAELLAAIDASTLYAMPLRERVRVALTQPEPEDPTDEELDELAWNWYSKTGSTWYQIEAFRAFARAVLARWGTPNSSEVRRSLGDEPQPIPVSERLPGPGDCDEEGRCWLLTVEDDYPQWRLHSIQGAQPGGEMIWVPVDSSPGVMVDCFYTSHWLPAHALPLPS